MPLTEQQEANLSLSEAAGTLAARGYNLIRKLGEGTYAKVYMASYNPSREPDRKILLACKVVDTSKAPKDFVRKFLPRELDILKRLNHPHIVHVHSIFQRKSKFYIFMRLAEKGDLLDWILRHGTVTESQSRVWLRQLALALQYLQILDIAHRDLKCENVLITANYNVKMADFGFARYVVDNRGRRMLSSTNCGSLSYAAPEILRGEQYDPSISDMWSLGVVLYIMLNKAMPFDDTNLNRLYEEQIHRRWRFCSNVAENLSNQVKHLVNSLLEPDTRRRLQVDQVLASEWIAMDQRLAVSTAAETSSVAAARQEQERRRRNRDRPGYTAPGASVAPINPTAIRSQMREVEEDDVSVRLREATSCSAEDMPRADPSTTSLPRIEDPTTTAADATTAATIATTTVEEEVDILNDESESGSETDLQTSSSLQNQPSHGAISIMESEPAPVTPPPDFIPPDLTERLLSKASSRTSKKAEDSKIDMGTTNSSARLSQEAKRAIETEFWPSPLSPELLTHQELQQISEKPSSPLTPEQFDTTSAMETLNLIAQQPHVAVRMMETKPLSATPGIFQPILSEKITQINTHSSHVSEERNVDVQQTEALSRKDSKKTPFTTPPEFLPAEEMTSEAPSGTYQENETGNSDSDLMTAISTPIEREPQQTTSSLEFSPQNPSLENKSVTQKQESSDNN